MKMRFSRRGFLKGVGAATGAMVAWPDAGRVLRAANTARGMTPDNGQAQHGHRADWMYQAKWGVFMHYLAVRADLPMAEWNRLIDGFDVENLASQIQSVGAGYFFITLGQNSGHVRRRRSLLVPSPISKGWRV